MSNFLDKAPLDTTPMRKHFIDNSTIKLVIETVRERWPETLYSLGVNDKYLKNKHGPCPACGGKDRYRFDDQGRGTFFCNICGWGDGIRLLHLIYGWDFPETIDRIARLFGIQTNPRNPSGPQHINAYFPNVSNINIPQLNENDIDKRRKNFHQILYLSKPVTIDDPIDKYLKSRGLSLKRFPTTLRYFSCFSYYENNMLVGKFPTMLALVESPNNGLVTIHRTYLGDRCKAGVSSPKKLMSPIFKGATKGAAIRLFEPTEILVVAEGIETALSIHIATGLPVWATVTAFGMENVIIPDSVKEVIIAVDHDESGRGQEAATVLSKRLIAENRRVKCVMPPIIGQDFNDVLLEGDL